MSLPQILGLGVDDADIVAMRVDDVTSSDEAALQWTDLPVMYPGQATWQWLNNDHPRAEQVRPGEVRIEPARLARSPRG